MVHASLPDLGACTSVTVTVVDPAGAIVNDAVESEICAPFTQLYESEPLPNGPFSVTVTVADDDDAGRIVVC